VRRRRRRERRREEERVVWLDAWVNGGGRCGFRCLKENTFYTSERTHSIPHSKRDLAYS